MRIFRKPSSATAIATLALVVAVGGGTAFAASSSLPPNSVGNAQIQAGAVSNSKIGESAVSLDKLTPSAQKSLRGQTGPQGPQGPKGNQGNQGPQGPAGADGYDPAVRVTNLTGTWVDHSGNVATPPTASGTSSVDAKGVELTAPNTSAYGGISTNALNGLTAAQVSTIKYTESYTGGTSPNAEPYIKLKLTDSNGDCGGDDVVYAPDAQNPTLSYPDETQTFDAVAPFSTVGVDNDAQPSDGNYATAIHSAKNGAGKDVSSEQICLTEIIFDGGSGGNGGTATINDVTLAGVGIAARTYVFGS